VLNWNRLAQDNHVIKAESSCEC